MIHRISVSNYFSIRDEAVLDLRIPKTAPNLPRFRQSRARPDVRLPSVAVLMGPNGSGKTKLLSALHDVAAFAVHSFHSAPRSDDTRLNAFQPFRATRPSRDPTRIRVDLEADWLSPGSEPTLFRYEIAVGMAPAGERRAVLYEALFRFPHGRPRRLFERRAPGVPAYATGDFELKAGDDRLKAVRDDASFISTLAALNVPLAEKIQDWWYDVTTSSNVSSQGAWQLPTDFVVRSIQINPKLETWINDEIQRGDLGISRVRSATSKEGESYALFDHHGLGTPVHLAWESDGTKRLFHLLPQLQRTLSVGAPVILDDFDSGLHVDMASRILHHFQSPETNAKDAQLFAAAHNVGLLDDLEKEELFIVEKDESGATRVHGAQDVRGLRRVNRLYPKYRAGMLGGVPRFG